MDNSKKRVRGRVRKGQQGISPQSCNSMHTILPCSCVNLIAGLEICFYVKWHIKKRVEQGRYHLLLLYDGKKSDSSLKRMVFFLKNSGLVTCGRLLMMKELTIARQRPCLHMPCSAARRAGGKKQCPRAASTVHVHPCASGSSPTAQETKCTSGGNWLLKEPRQLAKSMGVSTHAFAGC